MKKLLHFLYLILIGAELFVGTLLMISLWDSNLYIPVAIAVASLVGMLIWHIILFAKAKTSLARWKIRWNIAFISLIPSVIFAVVFVVVAVAFIIAFI